MQENEKSIEDKFYEKQKHLEQEKVCLMKEKAGLGRPLTVALLCDHCIGKTRSYVCCKREEVQVID